MFVSKGESCRYSADCKTEFSRSLRLVAFWISSGAYFFYQNMINQIGKVCTVQKKDDWCVDLGVACSALSNTFLLEARKEKTRKHILLEIWGLLHFLFYLPGSSTYEEIFWLSPSYMLQFLEHFEFFSVCTFYSAFFFFFLSLLYPQCITQSTSSLRVHAFILFILKADNSDLITIHFISLLETILFLVDKHLPPCSKKYIFSFLMLSQFCVKTKQKTDVLPPALCLVTISFIVSV